MTSAQRRRMVDIVRGLPSILVLAFVTAVTTIALILLLSLVLGADQRNLQRQAVSNAQEVLDHAVIARCEMAHVVSILKTIGEQAEGLDVSRYQDINTDGLDCERILREPFEPGLNYIDPDPVIQEDTLGN